MNNLSTSSFSKAAFFDFTGDGKPDMLSGNDETDIYIFINQIMPSNTTDLDLEVSKISPNPTANILNISSPWNDNSMTQLKLYNNLGTCLLTLNGIGKHTTLSLDQFPSGNYILVIANEERQSINRVIKH